MLLLFFSEAKQEKKRMLPTGHDCVRLENHLKHVGVRNMRRWYFLSRVISIGESVTRKRKLVF